MKLDYDKCPADYDLQELVERADFAVTYLGDKIRAMVTSGIVGNCMSCPTTFTMMPNHNWEITGYIQLCNSSVKYKYYAKLFMQTSEPNKITISRSDKFNSVTVGLDEESIKREIAKFPPPFFEVNMF